jgi:hypothetical protein
LAAGTVTIIGLAVAVIGVGVRLIAAFKPPQSQQAKDALGNAGYGLIIAGLFILGALVWVLYIPIAFQWPIRWSTPKSGTPPEVAPVENPSSVSPPPAVQSSGSTVQGDKHIGTTWALELSQVLNRLPKPCTIKVTAPNLNDEVPSVIAWVVSYGNPSGQAICSPAPSPSGPLNEDEPLPLTPTTEPGVVVHLDANFAAGHDIANYLDRCGLLVRISHRIPPNSPPNFLWIDIGPASPWK